MPADTARVHLPQNLWGDVKIAAKAQGRTAYGQLAYLLAVGLGVTRTKDKAKPARRKGK